MKYVLLLFSLFTSHSIFSSKLHKAAAKGNIRRVQWLCRHRKNLETFDADGNSPLHVAALNGYTRTIRYLTQIIRMDPTKKNNNGEDALFCAARSGEPGAVAYLLRSSKVNMRTRSNWYRTACSVAAQLGHKRVVSTFIHVLGKRQGDRDRLNRIKKERRGGLCPICLDRVPRRLYNVVHYDCMHFICGRCKREIKKRNQNPQCPLCRGPLG